MLAGPYSTMLLADLGAEIVKVETGEGDIARRVGQEGPDGHSIYFASLNRNKKSVSLDLTIEADRQKFYKLVKSAHGLLTNLRPSAIRKLGLTYDVLKEHNPKLACIALTGFGMAGPQSNYPAYDYVIQAMAGATMLTGDPSGPPVRVGYSVVDNSTGMMAAIGLLSLILGGRGGQLEVSLYDSMLSQLNYLATTYLNTGEEAVRHPNGGHAFFVPAQLFETKDGHVALFITHDRFWAILARETQRDDWLTDERFATMEARNRNREIVIRSVAEELARQDSAYWVSRLRPKGVVVAEVKSLADALNDEGTLERGMVGEINTPAGSLKIIASPFKGEDIEEYYAPPPRIGEHDALLDQ